MSVSLLKSPNKFVVYDPRTTNVDVKLKQLQNEFDLPSLCITKELYAETEKVIKLEQRKHLKYSEFVNGKWETHYCSFDWAIAELNLVEKLSVAKKKM